jgi:hypothetical protein
VASGAVELRGNVVAGDRTLLALTRARYAELLAAARAAVAAERSGDADPLGYVRAALAERGQLPPPGAVALQVVADARSALCLTGWPA